MPASSAGGQARSGAKKDMMHNSATPHVTMDTGTFEVLADGEHLTPEPAKTALLARNRFFF